MAVSARGWLRAIFGVQIGLALGMLGIDFAKVAPTLRWPSLAPALDEPVRPGDQTRRFAPSVPFLRPGRAVPGVDMTDMPSRLFFDEDDPLRVRVSGSIAEGDAVRFDEWLAARPPVDPETSSVVTFHSPGGSVDDALAIGRSLRAAGYETAVEAGRVCLSACPYMLAGGVSRVVSRRAQVGVHQHYYGEQTYLPAFLAVEDIQRGQAEVIGYLDAMGLDLRLMALAMATPPQDIYVFVEEELTDFLVATEMFD